MNWYLGISGIVFTILFVIWTKNGLVNFVIKLGFLALMLWSTFLNLQALGYIVKL